LGRVTPLALKVDFAMVVAKRNDSHIGSSVPAWLAPGARETEPADVGTLAGGAVGMIAVGRNYPENSFAECDYS